MTDAVLYEVQGKIAYLTLNRPDARNAVNGDVAQAMERAIDQLESDPAVWVGIGQAGALNTSKGGFGGFVYRDRKKPIIAAVDGLATAGGCELVLACDMLVATTRSAFGLAEVMRNLIAGAGGLFRLPRAIGKNAAMEVILTGQPLPAQRAYELGMVNHLVEPGNAEEAALALAERICLAAPLAVWASRKIVLAAAYESDEVLIDMTNIEFGVILGSEDTKEGLTAFIEKRPPNWQGR